MDRGIPMFGAVRPTFKKSTLGENNSCLSISHVPWNFVLKKARNLYLKIIYNSYKS